MSTVIVVSENRRRRQTDRRRHRVATNARISSLSMRLFPDVRITPAVAVIVRAPPERPFFHGANRSEAPAMPLLHSRASEWAVEGTPEGVPYA